MKVSHSDAFLQILFEGCSRCFGLPMLWSVYIEDRGTPRNSLESRVRPDIIPLHCSESRLQKNRISRVRRPRGHLGSGVAGIWRALWGIHGAPGGRYENEPFLGVLEKRQVRANVNTRMKPTIDHPTTATRRAPDRLPPCFGSAPEASHPTNLNVRFNRPHEGASRGEPSRSGRLNQAFELCGRVRGERPKRGGRGGTLRRR